MIDTGRLAHNLGRLEAQVNEKDDVLEGIWGKICNIDCELLTSELSCYTRGVHHASLASSVSSFMPLLKEEKHEGLTNWLDT